MLNSTGLLLLLAIPQSHLTLLFKEGKIFDSIFRTHWLKDLRECPFCLGVWTATVISILAGYYNPYQILMVAGLGHALFLLREKYLPCDKCKVPTSIPFKIIDTRQPGA
jgi:hypothetical protein